MGKTKPISGKTADFLRKLATPLRQHGFVLAGGTGLAMQLNHRLSLDLDFFTSREFDTERLLSELKDLRKPVAVLQESRGTLTLVADTVKASFFHFPHEFEDTASVRPVVRIPHGVRVAGIPDIGAMKIIAIMQRGTKRDFVDLYCIIQELPFRKVADRLVRLYGKERINPILLGKAFVYFTDAETDPEPVYLMSPAPTWAAMKRFFRGQVRQMVYDLQAALEQGS